ncbi:hypothetical protein ACSQ67_024665 [Phaseolus vulgaris]
MSFSASPGASSLRSSRIRSKDGREILQGTRDQARSYHPRGLSPVLDGQTHNHEAHGSGRACPPGRDVCKALAGPGIVFDTAKLIANEFKAHGLSTYFGIRPGDL